MYRKRGGTSGIRGQLYETKLISLLYSRAFHDDAIEEFYLASNIDNIGAFDDICFKAKVKGHDKPVAFFIQAKHKEKDNQKLEIELTKYFNSYLDIRNAFSETNDDIFFQGSFEETECFFIIYTNAEVNFSDELIKTSFSSHLYDLIGTSDDTADQKQVNDASSLQQIVVNHRVTSLAKRVAQYISKSVCSDSNDLQNILQDELVQSYHVLLARQVFNVSEIQPKRVEIELCENKEKKKEFPPHRTATFRRGFINIDDKYLTTFKDILIKEILRKRRISPTDIETLLSDFLAEPTDAARLSKLIGTVVTYNEDRLEYIVPKRNDSRPRLGRVRVSRSTVEEAVELAATEIFISREFKVPTAFGNKDLSIRGSDAKVEKRINHLTSRMADLLKKNDSSKTITLDACLEEGLLQLNGGLAGAIGNIFVLDDDPKLIKITDNKKPLGVLAIKLYEGLTNEIPNLLEYKFRFETSKFPKLTFDFGMNEQETNLARDFLNKLIFYSNQANENSVEDILKREMIDNRDNNDQRHCFQATNDAIFITYHDGIQKWWKQPEQAPYLTRESNLLRNAINNIIKDPMVSSINTICMSQIKNKNYTFSDDAVRSLNLQEQHSCTVIIAENSALTVVKVMQHLKNKDYAVLNLEYIVNLPPRDCNALCTELAKTNKDKHFMFICDNITTNKKKIVKSLTEAVKGKKTIVIMNKNTLELLNIHFPEADIVVHDEKNSLIDMTEESQKSILESATVMFQGSEVRLHLIVDDESKSYVKGVVLNKIISKETFVIGNQIISRNYDEIKHLYIDRNLTNRERGWEDTSYIEDAFFSSSLCSSREEELLQLLVRTQRLSGKSTILTKKKGRLQPKSLNHTPEMPDDVVLVTAESGMGKSTLLTHLSLKTKELEPEIWIVRINLLKYSREFYKWKEEHTDINPLETLKFMCQVILREKHGNDKNVEFELEEENSAVSLKHFTGDQWTEFELKLFVHFFYKRKMIILFDGFDEISPHYMNEVRKYLRSVSSNPRKHRIWITSRPYSEVKNILEQEFGSAYKIKDLAFLKKVRYLETFWKHNLSIKKLDSKQLENVKKFLDKLSNIDGDYLHDIYKLAANHFQSEIRAHASVWPYNEVHFKKYVRIISRLYAVNPLFLYYAALHVEYNIKSINKHSEEWYADLDRYTLYKRFLKTKIEEQFKKDGNDMYSPAVMMTVDEKYAKSILMHKKLGAFAIFNRNSEYIQRLFDGKELDEIKEMIKVIAEGADKTSLIDTVADGVPIFIHKSFAECFAVEYICDSLKNENICTEEFIECTLTILYKADCCILFKIFDKKIGSDDALLEILKNSKKVMFTLIIKQLKSDLNPIYCIFFRGKLKPLFSETLRDNLNTSNISDFVDLISKSYLTDPYLRFDKEFTIVVLDVVGKYDESKPTCVLYRRLFPWIPDYVLPSCAGKTSKEIFDFVRGYTLTHRPTYEGRRVIIWKEDDDKDEYLEDF